MYGVYAPDAETLRKVLDRPNQLLGYPFCAYLIYLARSVDATAVRFLEDFGAALDQETGEALAFIVLLDEATLSGTYDPTGVVHRRGQEQERERRWQKERLRSREHVVWPKYSQFSVPLSNYGDVPLRNIPELTDGRHEFEHAVSQRMKNGIIPEHAYYKSSPEWSLKFADHLGLSRDHLPCIVAFDDPGASDDESCIVIPLDDPQKAWNSIAHAISNFVMRPGTQSFIQASERARKIETDLKESSNRLDNLEFQLSRLNRAIADGRNTSPAWLGSDWPLQAAASLRDDFPSQSTQLLTWISSLSDRYRSFLVDAAVKAQDNGDDVTILLNMLENPAGLQTAREYLQTIRRLRSRWLQASDSEENPHIKNMLRDQVTAALKWLARPEEDLDRVLAMNYSDRESFIEVLEAHAPFSQSEVQHAWTALKEAVGPNLMNAVGRREMDDLQTRIDTTRQHVAALSSHRHQAMAELNSIKKSSFLPDLEQSVDQVMRRNQSSARKISSTRARIVKGATITAGGTGFIEGYSGRGARVCDKSPVSGAPT